MNANTAALLERHPRFRCRDPEELSAYLPKLGYELAIRPRDAHELDVRVNGVYLPHLALGYYHYGTELEIRKRPTNDDYWLLWPLRGQLLSSTHSWAVSCGPGHGTIISPRQSCSFRSQRGSARLSLHLNAAAVTHRLSALLGEPADHPLEFAPEIDLNQGRGRSLAAYLHLAVVDLEDGGSILQSSITASAFEELIFTGLLVAHPHNYTGALQRLERPAKPRDVKRAIDYIEANLDTTIGLPEIVAASRVPGRTLLQHFHDFHGTSPVRYLRSARYEKAREALRCAEPEESITEIAGRWGFSHMGRFSVEYRKRFGESPSQTLRGRKTAVAVACGSPAQASSGVAVLPSLPDGADRVIE